MDYVQKIVLFTLAVVMTPHTPIFAGGVGVVTGFPIPRFVSTRSDESNVRSGPGIKYPIRFVLTRQVPLQIIDEYTDWRQVKDWEGAEGWIHKSLLTGKLKAIVIVPKAKIYHKPSTNSPVIAKAEKNYILPINDCTGTWCTVDIKSIKIKGYVQKEGIWGSP